jgi:threonine dehydrogenase-like Zn-dependent dehydrogenase
VVDAYTESPGPDEVHVTVAYNGICATDPHIVHGATDERVGEGSVIGHDMSGVVVSGDEGTDVWAPGSHVAATPLLW